MIVHYDITECVSTFGNTTRSCFQSYFVLGQFQKGDKPILLRGKGGVQGRNFILSCFILCYSPGYLLSKMGSFVS